MPGARGSSAHDLAVALIEGIPQRLSELASIVPLSRDREDSSERREITRVELLFAGGVTRADLETEFGPLEPDQWDGSLEGLTPHWRVRVHPMAGAVERVSLKALRRGAS